MNNRGKFVDSWSDCCRPAVRAVTKRLKSGVHVILDEAADPAQTSLSIHLKESIH
jgi:hypothetical protein